MYGLHSGTELVAGRAPKIGVERTQGRSGGPHPGLRGSGRIRAAWGKSGPPARGERPTPRSRHGSKAGIAQGPKTRRGHFSERPAESYHAGVGAGSDRPRQLRVLMRPQGRSVKWSTRMSASRALLCCLKMGRP